MSDPDLITRTTELVDKLHQLLHDESGKGMATWCDAVSRKLTELARLAPPPTFALRKIEGLQGAIRQSVIAPDLRAMWVDWLREIKEEVERHE